MRGLLRTIGIVVAIALPGAAFAQGGYATGPEMHHHEYNRYNARVGVIHGRVLRTILPAGLIILQTRQGEIRLSGSPSQLAGINQGDRIRAPYVDYAGALWLSPDFGGGQARFMGQYGQESRFAGTIQSLDLPRGVIFVNGQRFRINPVDLQNVGQGEAVSLHVVRVGRASWVTRIHPLRGGFNR